MNTKLVVSLVALAIGFLGASSTSWAQAGAHIMVSPADLKWADVPSLPPGAKIAVIEGPPTEAVPFTFRLKFPANYRIPAHWHPAIEHVTVISGSVNLGIGDKLDEAKTKPLSAGSVAIMQPKTEPFRLDERGDGRSGARGRTLGCHLRQSRGRSTEEVIAAQHPHAPAEGRRRDDHPTNGPSRRLRR